MSSNSKVVLFFLLATVFNLLLMFLLVAVFFIAGRLIPEQTVSILVTFVGFIASVVLTFLIYGRVMKWATARFELEKHIPQLFKNRRK